MKEKRVSGDYLVGQIYYGIKTGLNKAFVIDEKVKGQLIHEDTNSKQIIKTIPIG